MIDGKNSANIMKRENISELKKKIDENKWTIEIPTSEEWN